MMNTMNSIFGIEEIYLVRHSTGVSHKDAVRALTYAYKNYPDKTDLVNNAIIIIHGRYPRVYQDF